MTYECPYEGECTCSRLGYKKPSKDCRTMLKVTSNKDIIMHINPEPFLNVNIMPESLTGVMEALARIEAKVDALNPPRKLGPIKW